MRLTTVAVLLWSCMTLNCQAALVDTYNRTDAAGTPTDSLGSADQVTYDYVERNNAGVIGNVAEILNNKLHVFGDQGVLGKGVGGAYLSGYDNANVTVSMELSFGHSDSAIATTDLFANSFLLQLRSRPGQGFGTASVNDNGLVGIELGPNGDLLIRQQNNGLSGVVSANPFTGASNTRRPVPGLLPAAYGGAPFDVNQNGYLDPDEPIIFGASVTGNVLKVLVNGAQIGANYNLALTGNPMGNGVGLHKNRISSANRIASDIFIDNLHVSPIPEPGTILLVTVTVAVVGACRRMPV